MANRAGQASLQERRIPSLQAKNAGVGIEEEAELQRMGERSMDGWMHIYVETTRRINLLPSLPNKKEKIGRAHV